MRKLTVSAVLLLLAGCQTLSGLDFDEPSASFAGVSVQDFGLDASTLVFDVDLRNPYGVPLPLVDVGYRLASEGVAFLDGEAALEGSVPANGVRRVALPVRVTYAQVLDVLQGVRPGVSLPYAASLSLTVDAPAVGPLALPIERSGKLPVPAVPKVSVQQIAWEEFGLTSITGALILDVENPNDFTVALERLAYGLELGGLRVVSSEVKESTELAEGGKGELRIPLKLSPLQLGVGLVNVLKGGQADYRLSGDLDVTTPFGEFRAPLETSGRAKLVQ